MVPISESDCGVGRQQKNIVQVPSPRASGNSAFRECKHANIACELVQKRPLRDHICLSCDDPWLDGVVQGSNDTAHVSLRVCVYVDEEPQGEDIPPLDEIEFSSNRSGVELLERDKVGTKQWCGS